MREIFVTVVALALAPFGVAAARAGTGTACTGAPGNQTGVVEAASKIGGTAGALPTSANSAGRAKGDTAGASTTPDNARRFRPRGAGRNRSSRGADSRQHHRGPGLDGIVAGVRHGRTFECAVGRAATLTNESAYARRHRAGETEPKSHAPRQLPS